MKPKYIALIAIILSVTGVLFAQTVGGLQVPRIDTTPTEQAEKGTLYAAASEDAYYFKAGGNTSTDWTKFNFVPLAKAVRTSVTLATGTATYTNTALSTNAVVFTSAKGTAAGFLTTTGPTTNGIVTVTSSTNSATNVVNLLILD